MFYLISFSLSGTYSHGTDDALLQNDDSIGEDDGDHSSPVYNKVHHLIIY